MCPLNIAPTRCHAKKKKHKKSFSFKMILTPLNKIPINIFQTDLFSVWPSQHRAHDETILHHRLNTASAQKNLWGESCYDNIDSGSQPLPCCAMWAETQKNGSGLSEAVWMCGTWASPRWRRSFRERHYRFMAQNVYSDSMLPLVSKKTTSLVFGFGFFVPCILWRQDLDWNELQWGEPLDYQTKRSECFSTR